MRGKIFRDDCCTLFIFSFVCLLVFSIDPNVKASMENKLLSPLHFACWFNAAEAVATLIDNRANVESCAAFGQKPLHYAVQRASIELVKVRIAFLSVFHVKLLSSCC